MNILLSKLILSHIGFVLHNRRGMGEGGSPGPAGIGFVFFGALCRSAQP